MKTHDVDDPGDDQGKPPEEGHSAEDLMTKPPTNITGLSLPFRGVSSCSVMSSDHRQTEKLASTAMISVWRSRRLGDAGGAQE
jgi:hypothetical protein